MSTEVANALDDAADHLEKHGWIQHSMYGDGESACAFGAIIAVTTERDMWTDREFADGLMRVQQNVVKALLRGVGSDNLLDSIPAWNDVPGRTEQEVLDTFRYAAKQERMADDHDAG